MKPSDNDSLMRLMEVIKSHGDFILVPDEKMPKDLFTTLSFKILRKLDNKFVSLVLPFNKPEDILCVVYHPSAGTSIMKYITALTPTDIPLVVKYIPTASDELYPVPELEEDMMYVDFSMFEVWKKSTNNPQ